MKYCEECGTQLSDNARFCKECGTKQDILPDTQEPKKEDSSKEKKNGVIIFSVFLTCAIVFAVIFVWMNSDKNKQKENEIIEETETQEIIMEVTETQEKATEEVGSEETQVQESTEELMTEESQVQESTTEEMTEDIQETIVEDETVKEPTKITMSESNFEYVPFEYFMGEYECVNVEGCHISISEIMYEQPYIVITEDIAEGVRYRDISGSYNGEKGYLYFMEVKEYIQVQEINDIVGYYRHAEYGTIGMKDGKLYWIDDSRNVRIFERVE